MSGIPNKRITLLKCRWVLGFFMFALVMSGLTAFPLERELELLTSMRGLNQVSPLDAHGLDRWLLVVRDGLRESYGKFPWLAYGTDWLAFAHVVLAIFFIGPFIDPVRNVWVLKAGVIACVLVIPVAMGCGYVRQIPFGWRLIDCSFGVFGVVPLVYCLRLTKELDD
jgi:hypothetical protein